MPATPEIFVPQGERETIAIVKETSFGVFPGATGAIFHNFMTFDPKLTDTPVARAPRGSLYSPTPATGGRSGDASFDPETDSDTIGQALAYALGAQTVPALLAINTTTNAASLLGDTSITVASGLNIFPGMTLSVDTSTNLEPAVVSSVAGGKVFFTAPLTKAHASGVTVTTTASTTAYVSTIKGGTPLPTFSIQRNTPGTVCRDYLGCKMDSVALSLSPKSGLGAKFNVFFQNQSIDGSPIAAALSTKNPIVFEQQGSSPILGSVAIGVGVEASVLSANITHSNNLLKDYFSLGNKNLVRGFPEQERKVSGTLVLDFATQTLMNDFLAVSANGNKTLVSLTIPLSCSDYADATLGIPYAFTLYIPKCFLSVYNQPGKTSGVLQQTVTFEAGESAPSANDALTIYHIGTSATAY